VIPFPRSRTTHKNPISSTSSLNFLPQLYHTDLTSSRIRGKQALIPLHIIKLTFNSLPSNQTLQFVDLKLPGYYTHDTSSHSTLPPSTSSHLPTVDASSLLNFLTLPHTRHLLTLNTSSLLNFLTPPHTPSHSLLKRTLTSTAALTVGTAPFLTLFHNPA
jgi:hypothetical protein